MWEFEPGACRPGAKGRALSSAGGLRGAALVQRTWAEGGGPALVQRRWAGGAALVQLLTRTLALLAPSFQKQVI